MEKSIHLEQRQLEIIQHIVPLLETVGEALEEIQVMVEELRFESCRPLLSDILMAVESIQGALPEIASAVGLEQSSAEEAAREVKEKLAEVVAIFDNQKPGYLDVAILEGFLPACRKWKTMLEQSLGYLTQN